MWSHFGVPGLGSPALSLYVACLVDLQTGVSGLCLCYHVLVGSVTSQSFSGKLQRASFKFQVSNVQASTFKPSVAGFNFQACNCKLQCASLKFLAPASIASFIGQVSDCMPWLPNLQVLTFNEHFASFRLLVSKIMASTCKLQCSS